MLSNNNNYISTLVSVGNDAQSHLYEVTFDGGFLTDIATDLSVRCSGFTPPDVTQDAYTVRYITAFIDRPRTKISVTRNFSLKFRMDDNWLLYKALLNQQKYTSNPAKSYASSDINELSNNGSLFNVHVDIIDRLDETDESKTVRLYNFKDCWIESITPSTFTGESSEPITVDVKIDFLKMEDWQSGLTGDKLHKDKISELTGSIKYD